MFIYFIDGFQVEIQQKALIGLGNLINMRLINSIQSNYYKHAIISFYFSNWIGSFLTRYNEYMMKDEIRKLYQTYIKNPNVPVPLKSQVNIFEMYIIK
jgi:hypothetical protein